MPTTLFVPIAAPAVQSRPFLRKPRDPPSGCPVPVTMWWNGLGPGQPPRPFLPGIFSQFVHSGAQMHNPPLRQSRHITPTNADHLGRIGFDSLIPAQTAANQSIRLAGVRFFRSAVLEPIRYPPARCPPSPAPTQNPHRVPSLPNNPNKLLLLRQNWVRSANPRSLAYRASSSFFQPALGKRPLRIGFDPQNSDLPQTESTGRRFRRPVLHTWAKLPIEVRDPKKTMKFAANRPKSAPQVAGTARLFVRVPYLEPLPASGAYSHAASYIATMLATGMSVIKC